MIMNLLTSRRFGLFAAAMALSLPLSGVAMGQAAPARPGVPGAKPVGLDSLDEDAVMGSLASYGQETLLNRVFEARNVPQDRRDAIKVLFNIRELGKPISNSRRITLLQTILRGLPLVYKTEKNPTTLMEWAAMLIQGGIEPDINTLEYWGENPELQARVEPLAKLVSEILVHASAMAEAEATRLAGMLGKGGNDQKIGDDWVVMDNMKQQAIYVKNIIAYYHVMGIPSSRSADRVTVADEALKYLAEFNNADSGVQPVVLNRMGKLQMAKGDYPAANATFDSVINGKDAKGKPVAPPPVDFQIYEAQYFGALSDLLAKQTAQAEKELNDLVKWQEQKLPAEVQPQVAAAAEMMKFRLFSTKADLAKDVKQKIAFDNQAATVLTDLGEKFPQYRLIILEQLISRINDQSDLSKQPPLVLQALLAKGVSERNKPENAPVDAKVLERGMTAAKLLSVAPVGQGGVTAGLVEEATLAVPLFFERIKGKELDAAKAYLVYAEKYGRAQPETAGQSVDRAFGLAFQLNKANPTDAAVKDLYEKAISTAANPPYARKELFYMYADHLRNSGQADKAVEFYRKVPKGDKMEFSARFWELYSLNKLLEDPKTPEATRQQVMGQMTTLIDTVRALSASQPPNESTKFRQHYTTILGADLALRQKNADRVVQLLQGFNEAVKGQPNEDGLIGKAHFLRTNAYLLKKDLANAANEVQALVQGAKDPNAGIALVKEVLDRLNADFEIAEKANNEADMAAISTNRAALTGHLVNWAASSPNPEVKKNLNGFKTYDANVKLQAAMLQKDPAQRKAQAEQAKAAYLALKQVMPEDTNVSFGLALAHFELAEYAPASTLFGTLIYGGKLGGGQITDVDPATGSLNIKDNPVYWEALYKWLRSNVERAKAEPGNPDRQKDLAAAKQTLRDRYITFRDKMGGEKWRDEFESLRKEIIPEFVPSAAPTTAPATQPVAVK